MNDPVSAMRLSGILLLFVFSLIVFERAQRGRARFDDGARGYRPAERRRLGRRGRWLSFAACLLPLTLGFLVPVLQLLGWAAQAGSRALDARFVQLTLHSFSLALTAGLLAVVAALLIAYAVRLSPHPSPPPRVEGGGPGLLDSWSRHRGGRLHPVGVGGSTR